MQKGKSLRVVGIILAALLSLSTVTLSGCSKTNPSSSKAGTSSAKLSGTITVASWNDAATAMQAEAKQFMSDNAGTTVTVLSVDSNYTKLYTELAAGSGVPDVVQTQNRDFMSFYNKYPKAWLDVTDLVQPQESNFDSVVLPLVKADGKYYAVPWDVGPCALYYRTDIFKADNIDPTTLTTWDAYIAAGKTISKDSNNKQKVMGFDYSGSTSVDMVNLLAGEANAQYYDASGKVQLDSPAMIQAIKVLQDMKAAGVTENLANEWNDRITAIENNSLVAFPYAVWFTGTMKNSCADQSGKWGIVPLPAFTAGGPNQANEGGSILAISSASTDTALAKAFVKFSLMTDQGNEINLTAGGLFTSYKPTYQTDAYKTISPYYTGVSIGQLFSSLSGSIPSIVYGPYYTDVGTAFNTAIGNIFVKGQAPATALDSATGTAQKAIDNE
jgi:lactose/L-arabinose transport system substrate-binding protein